MIVTYNWLKDFVDFDLSPQELCDRLTMAGLEVDSLEEIGGGLDSVIVAKLESVETHPDADRLTVCQVNNGKETVQVVCGATNHKSGDFIAFAQVGSVLPGDFKIKKSKIRGQESQGMLCSEKELGLAAESEGILILPADLPLGIPVFDALNLRDFRIEIGLTPNRPDCLSIVGVAREVAALAGKELKLPVSEISESSEDVNGLASVVIENADGCPRYAARMIKGVAIAPSPDWLVRRLEAVGMRSINNIVDVTNYVMMELGHPLHAFDYRFVAERKIVVKNADDNSKFMTLDDQERTLSGEDLMICDGVKPVALAGIMGGQNSEVQDDTTDILLEAAYFKPTMIRRSSKRHGLHTESSHRFERGADIDMIPVALDRAASLMAQLGQGQVVAGIIDNYPEPLKTPVISLSVEKTVALIAVQVAADQIVKLLSSIGLSVEKTDNADILKVTVPSFRPDIEREVDLIEEVVRLYGYDNIPVTMPVGTVDSSLPPKRQKLQNQVQDIFVGNGFSETISYSFVSEQLLGRLSLPADDVRTKPVRLLNPLSEDQAVMRTSLVPSMLESVARNLSYRNSDLRLFELRPVFLPVHSADASECHEQLSLVAAISGRREPEGWAQGNQPVDFFDAKGIVEDLLWQLGIDGAKYNNENIASYLHPGKSCSVDLKGAGSLGFIGEVHPELLHKFDIEQAVYIIEMNVETLISAVGGTKKFSPLSKFPSVIRDTALLLDDSVTAAQIIEITNRSVKKGVEGVTLFDLYTGQGIPAGKKSLAIRVRYRDLEKTLKEEEVVKMHDKLIRSICHQLGAEIR